MLTFKGKYTTADVMIDDVDETTISQIYEFINNYSFTNPVKIMPDTHAGKGAVIGFTMPIGNNVIPNIVGVDIACGMLSIRLDPKVLEDKDLAELDKRIRAEVPMGGNVHTAPRFHMEREFNWAKVQLDASAFTREFNKRYDTNYVCPKIDYDWFLLLCKRVSIRKKSKNFDEYVVNSIGTLGGCNHFIEIGVDERDYVWITVHSGSRNLGLRIATYWQEVAVKDLEDEKSTAITEIFDLIKEKHPKEKWQEMFQGVRDMVPKTPKGLEPLYGEHMYSYLIDTIFTYHYAEDNRWIMMDSIMAALEASYSDMYEDITTVHNYVDYKDLIIRKGAISSYPGAKMIIPFNMEDGTLICEGKGNPDWNFSAPHGAGRLFSRAVAKEKLSVGDARNAMEARNIYASVLPADELKGAYKSSEVIEMAIEPTATILHRIKPIMNLKAGEMGE